MDGNQVWEVLEEDLSQVSQKRMRQTMEQKRISVEMEEARPLQSTLPTTI